MIRIAYVFHTVNINLSEQSQLHRKTANIIHACHTRQVLTIAKFLPSQTQGSRPIVGCAALQQIPDSLPTSSSDATKLDQLIEVIGGKHIPRRAPEDLEARKAMKKSAPHHESRLVSLSYVLCTTVDNRTSIT